MTWPVAFDQERLDLHVRGRIAADDAARQTATVREILARLQHQPGVVLADEVGMGKTFVALAVAASAAWADQDARTVVVMVPPALKEKWPRDFAVFRERCLLGGASGAEPRLRAELAPDAVSFFRLLDDPIGERAHIVFLSHGALHNALQDPWVKLAILKRALASSSLAAERRVFPRFAGNLLRHQRVGEEVYADLLAAPTHAWRSVLQRHDLDPGDDPIPEAIDKVLGAGGIPLEDLRAELGNLPLRASEQLEVRLKTVRQRLADALKGVWDRALQQADFRSPLLILDEAHHLKNPNTRLASLFVDADSESDARLLEGALAGRFERMLFLTATPFQLGHHELVNVLDRFRGIAWEDTTIGATKPAFEADMAALRSHLDALQCAAADLDEKWKLIQAADVGDGVGALDSWWNCVESDPARQPERVQVVHRAFEHTRRSMTLAGDALRPWVIRHVRPKRIADSTVDRRHELPGDAIETGKVDAACGLRIRDDSVLPFLLAARCQAIVSRLGEKSAAVGGRITFAEGLASSYEAFLSTRSTADALQDFLDEDDLRPRDRSLAGNRLDWYFEQLQRALPREATFARHPKVAPTCVRALDLWLSGEKVLVFCHFRRTGRALAQHLSAELKRLLLERAAKALGCGSDEVDRQLAAIGERFEPDRPLCRQLRERIDELEELRSLDGDTRVRVFEVVRRFVRTPAFLVRYFPLGEVDTADLLAAALQRPDASGLSLEHKLRSFARFLVERCSPSERGDYLEALESIHTGIRAGGRKGDEGPVELEPNVRLANGETKADMRRRMMLAFNTPFFPEILIASSVFAEGVDLHLDCRHVIHHDLCWNPSTIEQRTGRVDRIGAKAERVVRSIQVFLPFVGGTQDEKMFRVVRDRERWFQVLMGEDYVLDDAVTERMAARVPLPLVAAQKLTMDLAVWPVRLEMRPDIDGP